MSTVENIQAQLDNGHFIAGVFIDLKKAFDTVDHNILTQNLEYYGVRGTLKDWCSSYLNSKKQYVSIKSYSSKTRKIIAGVPPGLCFRPISFP